MDTLGPVIVNTAILVPIPFVVGWAAEQVLWRVKRRVNVRR